LSTFAKVSTVKEKIDIRNISLQTLQQHFTQMGEKGFRAKQVYEWLWKKSCSSFDDMSNI